MERKRANDPPIWNYHSDGTGRDTYVLHDYGGLINHYKGPRTNFFRSNYENNSSENIFNNRMNNNSYLTRDEKIYQTKLTKIQKDYSDKQVANVLESIKKELNCLV